MTKQIATITDAIRETATVATARVASLDRTRATNRDAWSEAVRDARALFRCQLTTENVTDVVTRATVGRVTFISDTTDAHLRTETTTRAFVTQAVLDEKSSEIDALRVLMADDNWYGMTGEAQHKRSNLPQTLAALHAIQSINVPTAFIDRMLATAYRVAWFHPEMRERGLVAAVDELHRISRIAPQTGRGHCTVAAQRAIDGDTPEMILGAM